MLSHNCIEGRFIQSPLFLPAGDLHQSSEIGFRNMQTGKPHNWRFFNFGPLIVLFDPVAEVNHPTSEFLLSLRSKFSPTSRKITIFKGKSQLIKFNTHTNLTFQGSFQVDQGISHPFNKIVEPLELLEQHNSGGGNFGAFSSQHTNIPQCFRKF